MKDFNTNTGDSQEWYTPPEIFRTLGHFDLDPCAPKEPVFNIADKHYFEKGLESPWHGRVWLNPPYGRETFKWIEKLSKHGSGLALIFARTETKGFQKYVLGECDSILFIAGRVKFYDEQGIQRGPANAPSCIISYSEYDTEILMKSGIKGFITKVYSKVGV